MINKMTDSKLKVVKKIRACFLDISLLLNIEYTAVFNYGEFLC